MSNTSDKNFINSFYTNVRAGKKVTLANIRKAEKVQGQVNAARDRIAKALGDAKKQEGGKRRTRRQRKGKGTRRR